MSFTLYTPEELAEQIAERVRRARLSRSWTQAELAARSGIALPTYRQFERTGRISLERLIAAMTALGRAADWDFVCRASVATSLDDVDQARPRRRRGLRRPVRATG